MMRYQVSIIVEAFSPVEATCVAVDTIDTWTNREAAIAFAEELSDLAGTIETAGKVGDE